MTYTEADDSKRCRKCLRLTRSRVWVKDGIEPECDPEKKPCLEVKRNTVAREPAALP